ncbi:DUF1501 domain-containing protein [Vibrio maerlii]|uniref:DUF1501 domain-containing protein n=1 Tax=Vibrio maerlii TaxID=2231648 RepID=UPI000E3C218F|nr:DUF1501 domain-containing protein [Vibrio maerlii]
MGAVSISSLLPIPIFAKTSSPNIFVWITLRGAMDGLSVVIPHADPDYVRLRPNIAIKSSQQLPLNNQFSLHSSLKSIHPWFKQGQLSFVHACATPYRKRSHFDGQKILENGTEDPTATSGWLNRFIALSKSDNQGVAIDAGLPLIMQGDEPIVSWYPNRLKNRNKQQELLTQLFEGDATLSMHYQSLQEVNAMVSSEGQGKAFKSLCAKTGELLTATNGPNIAALELGGWDTHANQSGRLSIQLRTLDTGLASLKVSLGEQWSNTVVMVASEFGRTAKENGTKGTDHGTGNVMLLAGGGLGSLGINKAQVFGRWPGLSKQALYKERDLMPTTDMRSVIKKGLGNHLSVPEAVLEEVFPNSTMIKPMSFS